MSTEPFEASAGTYKFSRLEEQEIRLLRCHVDKHGQLIGELKTFPLDDTNLPSFRTVSYTWGEKCYSRRIRIDGQELPVLDSLYPYLRMHLRQTEDADKIWHWIDSLCINQADNSERNSQIKLMGRIYRGAAQCDVWLGEEGEESWRAFKLLDSLHRSLRDRPSQSSKDWIENVLAPRKGPYGDDWTALEKLFARPWWTRVWTAQEFVLSKHTIFCCGTLKMSRSLFRKAIHAIWGLRNKKLKYDGPWNRIRLHEWYRGFGEDEDTKSQSVSLTATLAYLGNHQATDPRDRIYSLCGIVKDPQIAGTPDYNEPVEIVYINLARSFIEVHRSLDIICFASIFRDKKRSPTSLPSWVPDWRATGNVLVGPLMVSQGTKSAIGNLRPLHALGCTAIYSASLCVEPNVAFSADFTTMTCRGIVLDRIDGLAGLPMIRGPDSHREPDELIQPSSSCNTSQELTSGEEFDLLTNVMKCLILDREDHYFNHAVSGINFLKQFASLLSKAVNHDTSLRFTFRAWYAANRKLLIRGWRLEDLVKTFLEKLDLKGHVHDDDFNVRLHDTLVKMRRRFIITSEGLVGMAPQEARKGDVVCILFGCSVPVVLRWCAEQEAYLFTGECYLNGFMNGEGLAGYRDSRKKEFRII
ncbi:heterokaryon incompatibility protein-domain-containing protein [Lophiotrema nucula]|uniref:Heterokaryon incompatibility protein-domain-containing protein n=1 Tax=Lophiotrema nucula TaxID=690887 RepID=A0A6A5YIH4_9PLEO|nr:heterokaryon incompatibility protein-domain-containing protein [Lophiotrema nucula]